MQWCNLGDYTESTKTLFLALSRNDTIEELNLSNCGILSSLAKSLAIVGLKPNVTLRNLDISWNKIGDQAGEAFLDMLKLNKNIQNIILNGNNICSMIEKSIENQLIHNVELHLKQTEMVFSKLLRDSTALFASKQIHTSYKIVLTIENHENFI